MRCLAVALCVMLSVVSASDPWSSQPTPQQRRSAADSPTRRRRHRSSSKRSTSPRVPTPEPAKGYRYSTSQQPGELSVDVDPWSAEEHTPDPFSNDGQSWQSNGDQFPVRNEMHSWQEGSESLPSPSAEQKWEQNHEPLPISADTENWPQHHYGAPRSPYGDSGIHSNPSYESESCSIVERYRSTSAGKLKVAAASAVSGSGLGAALSAYIIHKPKSCILGGSLVGILASFFGGKLGEVFRALGVTLIIVLERWRSVTVQYPLVGQAKALILNRRNRFPPNAPPNLRRYKPSPEYPMEFSMSACFLGAGLLGGLLGWLTATSINFFLLPPWLVAVVAGGFLTFFSTSETTWGDLVRCAAMKSVGISKLFISSAAETQVPGKTLALAGFLGEKAVAFDNRYHVKDRVFAGSKWFIDRMAAPSSSGKEPLPPQTRRRRKGKRPQGQQRPYSEEARSDGPYYGQQGGYYQQ